jgi:hypothetical protein
MPFARIATAALAGLWAGPALAQTLDPPAPPPRPGDGPRASAGGRAPAAPLPPPRPSDLGRPAAEAPAPAANGSRPSAAAPSAKTPPAANASPAANGPPAAGAPTQADLLEHEACLESLARLGVRFEPLRAIRADACGAERPLRISLLPGGVQVSPPATMVCPMAEALGRWTADALIPEARRLLDRRPLRLVVGTSYECRGQNRAAGVRLSEHGFANAVDIMGVAFDGDRPYTVAPLSRETLEGRFQTEIQARACAYFGTVLGPGSDASHSDHLHFDMRGRKGAFRICQ